MSKSKKKIVGGTGITAGGDVSIGDVSGADIEELRKSLLDFQKGVAKLNLLPEDQSIVYGYITVAIKEANTEKPTPSGIKEKFESVIHAIKEAGKTIKDISELYEPAKKIAKLFGVDIEINACIDRIILQDSLSGYGIGGLEGIEIRGEEPEGPRKRKIK